jgi:transposase
MAGKKRMKQYPVELKLEAVQLFYEEGRTRAAITDMLSIRDLSRAKAWLSQYRRDGEGAFRKVRRGRLSKKENTQAYIAAWRGRMRC